MTALRILHVVGGMDVGGIQSWLMSVLRRADRERCQMDFLVHSPGPFDYSAEIEELGGTVIVSPSHTNPLGYVRSLRRLLSEGDYAVVHAHLDQLNGLIVMAAAREHVRHRISHAHVGDRGGGPLRSPYRAVMRRLIRAHSTTRFACSRHAAEALFGGRDAPAATILPYGIELDRFATAGSPSGLRERFSISESARVVGVAARFTEEKNLLFWIDIAHSIAERHPEAHFLLVGDGPQRALIEERAARRGIADRCHFVGVSMNIPELLCSAMDLVLLPSRYEGLPLLLLEAQAAGIHSLCSDRVTPDVIALDGRVVRFPLSARPDEWATVAVDLMTRERDSGAASRLRGTSFDIDRSARDLLAVYERG